MTLPMLEVFRLEIARVSLSIDSCESSNKEGACSTGLRYYPRVNEFVLLRTTITNLTCRTISFITIQSAEVNSAALPLVFTMDMEATPSEYLVHEGVLTDLPVGRLEGGQSKEILTSICFLTSGHFEISALVRGFGGSEIEGRVAKSHITAILGENLTV